jgi:hypothetical protein
MIDHDDTSTFCLTECACFRASATLNDVIFAQDCI